MARAMAVLWLGTGAAAILAPHPTYALMTASLPTMVTTLGVSSPNCGLLEVAPEHQDFGDIHSGHSWQGHILNVVRGLSTSLPVSASVTGKLASALTVSVTPDQTAVNGVLTAPTVTQKTVLDGTIVVSMGNNWCVVKVPATVTVLAPTVTNSVYGQDQTVTGDVYGQSSQTDFTVTQSVYGG